MWGQCREPLGAGGHALQASEEQTGPCVAAVLVPGMIEHRHPSVVNGPSSFPASLASAYLSPAVLDQPIHHTDWCSPHQFSTFLVIQTCLELHRFFSASSMRATAARPAESWGNREAMTSLSEQELVPPRRLSQVGPCTSPCAGRQWHRGACREERSSLDLPSCFALFPQNDFFT